MLAIRAIHACGNAGPFATTIVDADFGPYSGHALLIGHDYSDTATPPVLVANSVGMTPFVRRNRH